MREEVEVAVAGGGSSGSCSRPVGESGRGAPKGSAGFSVTRLSVLPGEGQMLVITWSQTESDQKRGKGGTDGERERGRGREDIPL